ncbi:MAG: AAA family ATPase [Acidimicrobiales bacterium]
MLLRFAVSNHRSILDSAELSMIAVDDDRPATRGFDRLSERVLTVAGVYGPNASGKSNVLDAIAWLSRAVSTSLKRWEDFIPRDPHRFGNGMSRPSTFSIEFMSGGIRYDYSLEVNDDCIVYESLHSYPERRRRLLFERDLDEIDFRRGTSGQVAIRELLSPTTLALSAALRYDDPDLRAAGLTISRIGTQGLRRPSRFGPPIGGAMGGPFGYRGVLTERFFDNDRHSGQESLFGSDDVYASRSEAALALLKFADLGIDGVEIVEDDSSEVRGPRRRVQLIHRSSDGPVAFELFDESEGTRTWFRLIGPALAALDAGQLLIFDEIDASLHPRLSARLLELFQDSATNPNGAQLIFTTHDTSLLGCLNRDEVWLTEKDDNGATTITALADYGSTRVRQSLNLEKAYLQGRFGGVPELDQMVLKHALGLAN